MSELLQIDPWDAALRETIFAGKIHCFQTIDSTNTRAMREAAEGAAHGTVYVADEQTAGRGRGTHAWHSEPHAGLYCSILVRPQMPPANALWFSLAAGLAVQQAVENVTALVADIRWPNDLLLGNRKFCGILTEMNAEATRVRYAVVGVGINVNHSQLPLEFKNMATSLRIESGHVWPRAELLVALLQSIDAELRTLMAAEIFADATEAILTRMERRSSWTRGKRVTVDEAGGYTGVTAGLDARGFLLVDTPDGVRTVLSGGVREAKSTAPGISYAAGSQRQ